MWPMYQIWGRSDKNCGRYRGRKVCADRHTHTHTDTQTYTHVILVSVQCNGQTIMMTYKLTWRNWRRLWHVYVCRFSRAITKIPFKRDWWFWCCFVLNLSGYRWANNCCNIRRFGRVIAKIKQCSFLASQCRKRKQLVRKWSGEKVSFEAVPKNSIGAVAPMLNAW